MAEAFNDVLRKHRQSPMKRKRLSRLTFGFRSVERMG
jgi:hypothetical protein